MSGVVFLTRGVSSGFAAAQRIDGAGPASIPPRRPRSTTPSCLSSAYGPHPNRPSSSSTPTPRNPTACSSRIPSSPSPVRASSACGPHDTRRGEVPPVADAATQVRWDSGARRPRRRRGPGRRRTHRGWRRTLRPRRRRRLPPFPRRRRQPLQPRRRRSAQTRAPSIRRAIRRQGIVRAALPRARGKPGGNGMAPPQERSDVGTVRRIPRH